MPGLLDFANTDDGMQGLGLLGAAAPMMAPMNLAGRLAMAAKGYQGLKDDALKQQAAQQELAIKNVALQQQQANWEMSLPLLKLLSGVGNQAQGGQPSQSASSGQATPTMPFSSPINMTTGQMPPASMPSQSQSQNNPQGSQFPLNLNQVTALKMLGKGDFLKEFEIGNTGSEQKAGSYYRMPDGSLRYMDNPKDGFTYDPTTKSVMPIAGSAETSARAAAMTTTANKSAEGNYDTTTVTPAGGPPTMVTINQLLGMVAGKPGAMPSNPSGPITESNIRQRADINNVNIQTPTQSDVDEVNNELMRGSKTQNATQRQMLIEYRDGLLAQMKAPAGTVTKAQPSNGVGLQLQSPAQLEAEKATALAGVTQNTKPQLDYSTNAAQSFQKMGDNINNRLSESQELMKRLSESRNAITQFSAGGGAETKANLAQLAQAFGVPENIVNKIAGGNLAAVQVFQKFAAQEALQTMQQSLATDNGPAAKGNRMAMEVFIKNNPNISTDPHAIEKVFNFQTKLHNDALAQSDAYVDYASDPTKAKDAAKFGNYWAHQNLVTGRVNPVTETGQALGTTPTASAGFSASVNGKTYTFPTQKALTNFKLEAGIK